MRATYDAKGNIAVNLQDILEMIPAEQKLGLIESMSCDTDLIAFVAQQIIHKWTENGYSGGSYCTASDAPTNGLDKAWRDVAKASGDIAKREIERLEAALASSDAIRLKLATELADMRFHRG